MASELIPKDKRHCELPTYNDTLSSLKDSIIEHVERYADEGAAPLKLLGARWNRACIRHDTKLQDILEELAKEGRLAVHYFKKLGRTYVLTAQSFNEILKACDGRLDTYDWDAYGKGLDASIE